MSPLQRTMQYCRKQGWLVDKSEYWNPFAHRRIDLFDFIDAIAISELDGIIAIQATTKAHFAEREQKILANENAKAWIKTGNPIYLFGWGKKKIKRGGKKEIWDMRLKEITLQDFQK